MINNISIIKLSKLMAKYVDESEWTELFTLCESDEYIPSSFWKDVSFRNPELLGSVIRVLNMLFRSNSDNISNILRLERFSKLLKRDDIELFNEIKALSGDVRDRNISSAPVNHVNETIYQALDNAELLIFQKGPEFSIDRVHTAMHASLKLICENNGILFNTNNSNINGLLAQINEHLKSTPQGDRNAKVYAMLRSATAILDVINQLRNHHSMAHPSKMLLNEADARFAINLTRSIMVYVDELMK